MVSVEEAASCARGGEKVDTGAKSVLTSRQMHVQMQREKQLTSRQISGVGVAPSSPPWFVDDRLEAWLEGEGRDNPGKSSVPLIPHRPPNQ